jgi:predicted PolB exonuclease-like 3'-5' exonuclease
MPVLELRSLKLGVPAPRWFQGPRAEGAEEHLDLVDLLTGGRASPAAPLDLYAKLVGLPGKEEVAGRDVHVLYAEGALDRVAAYCMTDVVQTWLLFLRWRLVEGSLSRDGYAESVASVREDLPAIARRSLPPAEARLLDGFLGRSARFLGESEPVRQAR